MKAVTLSVVSVMLGLSTQALAACPTSPYNYNAATCNSCCAAASGTLTCTVAGASAASEVVVVSNYTADSNFEAWGYYEDSSSGLFCCSISSTGVATVVIEGSDAGDALQFNWFNHTYDLSPLNEDQIAGIINGDDGNDVIRGANASDGYTEVLNGDGGHDTVYGDGGDDTINGGTGNDTLIGGVGDDTMVGDDGDDTMTGGSGDDDMEGGNGNDTMGGGAGDDVMDGGAHRDLLCGGDQAGDVLTDGDASSVYVDRLFGRNASASLICGDASTAVDDLTPVSGPCSANTILGSSAPTDCP